MEACLQAIAAVQSGQRQRGGSDGHMRRMSAAAAKEGLGSVMSHVMSVVSHMSHHMSYCVI